MKKAYLFIVFFSFTWAFAQNTFVKEIVYPDGEPFANVYHFENACVAEDYSFSVTLYASNSSIISQNPIVNISSSGEIISAFDIQIPDSMGTTPFPLIRTTFGMDRNN